MSSYRINFSFDCGIGVCSATSVEAALELVCQGMGPVTKGERQYFEKHIGTLGAKREAVSLFADWDYNRCAFVKLVG